MNVNLPDKEKDKEKEKQPAKKETKYNFHVKF